MATWQGNYPSAMYDGMMEVLVRDVPDRTLAPLRELDQDEPFGQRWRAAGERFGQNLRMALLAIGADASQRLDALDALSDFCVTVGDGSLMVEGAYLVDAEGTPGEVSNDNRQVTITHTVYAFSGNDHNAIFIVAGTPCTDQLILWCQARKMPFTVLS